MTGPVPSTLESFHRFVGEQLQSNAAAPISPEQVLALWHEREETLSAIREGLADIEAGRTRPADEVLREVRRELGEA